MNRVHTTADDFKRADAASYDAHVESFERFSASLTTPLARRLVAMANVFPGQRVLDVGTGTAVVALEAAKAIGSAGQCIGVDLSERMLASARTRLDRFKPQAPVEFLKMDAESLQFAPASFDVVLSLFALLHFPNPDIALTEMFRVLKPGGTLVIAVGSAPPWFSFIGLKHAAKSMPEIVARLSGHRLVAPKFLERIVEGIVPSVEEPEESALASAGRNRTRTLMRLVLNAGFVNLRAYWEEHRAIIGTAADFWDIQRTFSSIARKRLNRATPEQTAKVRTKFEAECGRMLARGGKLIYPVGAFFVSATRPQQT